MANLDIPRKLQSLLSKARLKIVRGGRGGGKSHAVAGILLVRGASEPLRVLCCREVQKSIKQSVHQLLCDKIAQIGLSDFYAITENEIRGKNGTQFLFAGLRELGVDQIKSYEGIDICWIEEAQTISQRSIDILFPTIRKPGSEIWALYNPILDIDPIHLIAEAEIKENTGNAIVIDIGLDDNPWATEELRDMRDMAYKTDPIKAAEVWGGKCRAAAEGAIYAKELQIMIDENRICNVPYQESARVVASFDLGRGDHTSLIIGQYVGLERHIFHTYENYNEKFAHYITHIRELPYKIDVFELPHDARNDYLNTGAIAIIDEVKNAFPGVTINCPKGSKNAPLIEEGINNVRNHFNKLYIDRNCVRLIECLKNYKRKKDEKTGLFEEPLHDGYSDMVDSLRYWMLHVPYTPIVRDFNKIANINRIRSNPF
jgi:phage terminase large subunit